MTAAPVQTPSQQPHEDACTLLDVLDVGRIRRRPTRSAKRLEDGRQQEFWLVFHPDVKGADGVLYNDSGAPFKSADHAELVRVAICHMADKGGVPLAQAIQSRRAPSDTRYRVSSLAPRWLAELEQAGESSAHTLISYRHKVRAYFGYWDRAVIHKISTRELKDWRAHLRGECNLTHTSASNVMATFKSFLRWYGEEDDRFRQPKFPKLTKDKPTIRVMSLGDQIKAISAVPDKDRGIYIAQCCWSRRQGEVRALTIGDVDRKGRRVWVGHAMQGDGKTLTRAGTKTGAEDWFRIPDMLWDWIVRQVPADAWFTKTRPLFASSSGGVYTRARLGTIWKRACRRADVEHVPPSRAARHSTLSGLAELGLGAEDLMAMASHANPATTYKHYIKPSAASKEPGLSAWEKATRDRDGEG